MLKELRAVAVVLAAAHAAAAGQPDLAAVRQQLAEHPAVPQRKAGALHHRAAMVSAILEEAAAEMEPGRLAVLRETLRSSSRMLEGDFASIGAKLGALGLAEKTHAWDEFVRHYRTRLAELDAELGLLADGRLSRAQQSARLESLRKKLGGSRARLHETVKRSRGARVAAAAQASPESVAAEEAPTAADLAETRIVALTASVRARAAALRGDAEALYQWVATHVEYFPALGQMQNSQAVLQSGRGNDFDQATLLIALLRAAGVPARYVCGDVVMPRADVREWMGLKDETLALELLGRSADFLLFPSIEKDRVTATRVWVEAYLDTADGKRWMTMDPARKRRNFQPGIVLARPPYDRMAYLSAQQPVPPGEPYLDALRSEFHKKYPGRGFNEVAFAGALAAPPPAGKELAYPLAKLHFRAAEPPASYRHRIRLTLGDSAGRVTYLAQDLVLPEVILESITLSFNPATAADRQVIEAFGGLENAPAAVVNLLPEFRLAGQVIATGKAPIPAGASLNLTVTHTPPVQGAAAYASSNDHYFTAGETAALVLGAHLVSDAVMNARLTNLSSRLPALSSAEATRLLLDVAATRYLHRVEIDEQRLSGPLQVRFYPDDEVGNAITFASLEPQNLFDRPFVVTPGRLQIHAWPTCLPFLDLNRSDHDDPVVKSAWQLHNDAISALEHEVWEELVLIPTVSTIKILQAALRQNMAIRVITPANAAAGIRGLDLPQTVKDMLQARANQGATLTVPQGSLAIGAWRGTGWIEEFANWDYNYIIFDFALLSNGGDTGGTAPPPRPPQNDPGTVGSPAHTNNTTCADPVNVANGNLFEQTTDFTLGLQGPGILFQRTYNSLAAADGPLGPGWRHSYLIALEDKGATVVVKEGSGTSLTFRQAGMSYSAPTGYPLTLAKNAQGYILRTKHGMETRFDARGVLQSITDRNQHALLFAYESDRLRRIAGRGGQGVTLSYDGRGRLAALEDSSGRRVTYEYDGAGHLAAVTNAAGHRTVYTYYTDRIYNHLLKSVTTPEGRATTWDYYGNGKVARVTLPGGQATSFLYLPLRNETHVIDPKGLLTSYRYNGLGNVVRIVRPDGSYLDRTYNSEAKLESQTDAAGYTTRYSHDTAGNLTSVTDALGRTVRFTYDPAFHLVTSVTDAAGRMTQFEYDARGNLARTARPLEGETRYTRDAAGNMTARTDAGGNTIHATYDDAGNPVTVRDALGNETRHEYDRLKRVIRTVDATGAEARWEYDAMDRRTRYVDPLGRATALAWDRDGRISGMTDAAGRTGSFRYDALGHLSQVVDPGGQATEYLYAEADCGCSAASNLSSFRDASGYVRRQSYDFLDRLAGDTGALGYGRRFGYDAQGNLAMKRDADGSVTVIEHDAVGRVTRKLFGDGSEARFAWDAANNLVSASNQHVAYTFAYNELNRLTAFTDSRFGKTFTYAYDRLGRRTSLTDSEGGVFLYAWDAAGRMTSIRNPGGATATFAHDAAGRPARLVFSNGAATESRYDAAGRLTARVRAEGPAYLYEYDNAGNVSTMTDSGGTRGYEYDALDRLVAAPGERYRYDAAGNRLASASDPAYAYDAAGRLTAAEGATFEYDRNGNLVRRITARGTTTYTWDAAGQLARIGFPDGGEASYKYDPLGRRIEKNVNGTVTAYVYDLSAVLLETDSRGAVAARYTHGPGADHPLMMERGGETYFYHLDGGSNVRGLTDSAGGSVCEYVYDSFGRSEGCGKVANPYGFASREYDGESGLYFMRARYYDPALGRFLSPDPLDLSNLVLTQQDRRAGSALLPAAAAALAGGRSLAALRSPQQLNAYSYALNNPGLFRDPSGLSCSVHVQMGWEAAPWGATGIGDNQWSGNINNFNHWLQINNYSLVYTGGPNANITSSGQVIGVVQATDVGFTEMPFEETPSVFSGAFWQQVGAGLSDVGQSMAQNFQASFQVPWHQLHGQEYWDAANNPQNYVRK